MNTDGLKFNRVMYADDIVLTSNLPEKLQDT